MTIDTTGYEILLTQLNNQYNNELGQQQVLKQEIQRETSDMKNLEDESLMMSKIITVMTQTGQLARDQARAHFEKIVTDALQFVTQSSDYKFIIQDKGGAKPAYDFFIESPIDGKPCLQKPEDANGGGFIDIISTTLKYAYLEIFDDPTIKNAAILLDEPGKMISNEMSIKFAEYLKFLGKHFNKQTIMITHNSNLSATADAVFLVEKEINGTSKVSDMSLSPSNIITTVEDIVSKMSEVENSESKS